MTYIYEGPFELPDSAIVRAVSVKEGKNNSDIVDVEFVYNQELEGQMTSDEYVEIGTYNALVEPGDVVTLNFNITDNPGLVGYVFNFQYVKNALEIVDARVGDDCVDVIGSVND